MPRRGFDADLKRDPDEGDRRDAAVPQYNRERRAFKRRHRNLVEYSLRRSRLKVRHEGETLKFEVEDRNGGGAMPVSYQGVVPDPFRGGREIVLTGAVENGTFVGEPESLITKCPSKFTTNASETAGTSGSPSSSNG